MVHKAKTSSEHSLALPLSVVSPSDVGRLLRELESIDNLISQSTINSHDAGPKIPKTSLLMEQTIELSKLDLLKADDRKQLLELLKVVKQQAPLLHISFSSDPAPAFIEKLMAWLRREIHPTVLLTIGLQPNIGAGCLVRSTNKYFDLSLRKDLLEKRELLLSKIASDKVTA